VEAVTDSSAVETIRYPKVLSGSFPRYVTDATTRTLPSSGSAGSRSRSKGFIALHSPFLTTVTPYCSPRATSKSFDHHDRLDRTNATEPTPPHPPLSTTEQQDDNTQQLDGEYDPSLESKWQRYWLDREIYAAESGTGFILSDVRDLNRNHPTVGRISERTYVRNYQNRDSGHSFHDQYTPTDGFWGSPHRTSLSVHVTGLRCSLSPDAGR
jgi:hypothetical protein